MQTDTLIMSRIALKTEKGRVQEWLLKFSEVAAPHDVQQRNEVIAKIDAALLDITESLK